MADKTYLDLDVLIERSGENYKARILRSPAGSALEEFNAPFSSMEIENLILRIGRPRQGMRRMESPDLEAIKVFGGRLFSTIFQGQVGSCLRSSLDQANQQDAGLRLRLQFADVPDLVNLPWEYLYNPSLNRFIALSSDTPIIRYLELPEPVKPLAVKPPLRVLAMISSPSDYPPLDVEREWANLKEALAPLVSSGKVLVDRLESPTLSAMLPNIRQYEYHIFHFIGHGGFDQQAQDGVLLLEGEAQRGRAVSGQELGTLLHDERTLRLAVLNACEGGRASPTDPFAGVAQSLVQQRIPAVIAMQFEISDEAAIAFSRGFYGALADGYPVDAALAEARKSIYALGNEMEWGTPVLYTCLPDGNLFDIQPSAEAAGQPQSAAQVAPVAGTAGGAIPGVTLEPTSSSVAPPPKPPAPAEQKATPAAAGVPTIAEETSVQAKPARALPLPLLVGIGLALVAIVVLAVIFGRRKPGPVQPTGTAVAQASPIPADTQAVIVPPLLSETSTLTPTLPRPTDTPTGLPTATPEPPTATLTEAPSLTPTFGPGADLTSNCIAVALWTPIPEKLFNAGRCWDLSDRGFQARNGHLDIFLPDNFLGGDGTVHGLYLPLPAKADLGFALQIDALEASHKGALMFGIIPQPPVYLTTKSLFLIQNEGPGLPLVMKVQDQYLKKSDGSYYTFDEGRPHKVAFRLDGRTFSVYLDGSQVGSPIRLLFAPNYYFWAGYSLNGRTGSLKMQTTLWNFIIQER
jgi:hypothetical protein